jgi:hypothetical protein
MMRWRFGGQAQTGQHEGRAEFCHQFFGRIAGGAEPAGEITVQAMLAPVQ